MDGVVTVSGGRVRGVRRGDLWSFSGIPYAGSPEGERRWRVPLPVEPWVGIRDATTFGPISPQPAAVAGITSPADPDSAEPQSEDCLTLNIWTPHVPDEPAIAPRTGRPVMVWIHGGGFTTGSGSVFLYRGGNLVRNGDVVVVTINYRLGALGFLGHPALMNVEGHVGNWGLHDQVAALQWVRQHIAHFGGDPENVTIFGESAGGFSVADLLGVASARHLFRRAIVQSGGIHLHTKEQASTAADHLVAELGLRRADREVLVSVPAADLVAATTELGSRRPEPGLLPLPFLPVLDGRFFDRHPLEAVAEGRASDIDLMVGTNRDELTLFELGNPALQRLDESGAHRWIANAAPDILANELLDAYVEARVGRGEAISPRDLWIAIGTDAIFRWPSLQLAAAHHAHNPATYVYLFDWESPAFGGVLGSCHALEIPFVFGAVGVPAVQLFTGGGAEADLLSMRMQAAWLSFARTGDPSAATTLEWPQWDSTDRQTMVFGRDTRAAAAPRDQELAPWERHRTLGTWSPAS